MENINTINEESAVEVIKYYNTIAGTSVGTKNEKNQQLAINALYRAHGDISTVRAHIIKWIDSNKTIANGDAFGKCIAAYKGTEVQLSMFEAPKPQKVDDKAVNYSMSILERAVVELIAKTNSEKIENEILGQVKGTIQDFIKSEYGHIERNLITAIDGKPAKLEGVTHEKFETIVKFVNNDEPVFLTGPAGSGKNHLCKQVADALGLNFYFTNAVTQEYKLTGFTDAMGNYQPTQFYEAFKNGGLFLLDEMDASIPEVLVILNAAIANRYFDFPAPIGMVHAHKDFRVIAAGNTTGHGASYEYVGRNQLDAASLDRFAVVKIDYSPKIEESLANGDEQLLNFLRDYRRSALVAGQQVIVSYRAIGRLAKMTQILTAEEALETCLTRGSEKDDLKIIEQGLEVVDNKYRKALKRVINSMN